MRDILGGSVNVCVCVRGVCGPAIVSHYLPVEFINVASRRYFLYIVLFRLRRPEQQYIHTRAVCAECVDSHTKMYVSSSNRMNRKKEIKFIYVCSGEKQKKKKLVVSYPNRKQKKKKTSLTMCGSTNSSLVCFYVFEFRNVFILRFSMGLSASIKLSLFFSYVVRP